jgi:hypothetical protein
MEKPPIPYRGLALSRQIPQEKIIFAEKSLQAALSVVSAATPQAQGDSPGGRRRAVASHGIRPAAANPP